MGEDLDYDTCTDPCDRGFTLDMADFSGFTDFADNPAEVRYVYYGLLFFG